MIGVGCYLPAPLGYGLSHPHTVSDSIEVVRDKTHAACMLVCEMPPDPIAPARGFLVAYGGPSEDTCVCEVKRMKPATAAER